VSRLIPPLILLSFGLGCSKAPLHAALESAGELEKGSRVYAAGVAVGEVEAVTLQGVVADVKFVLRPGQTLSLRADACALSLPDADGALLVLFPGRELERLGDRAVPSCETDEPRLLSLKQLASSGGGALSQSIHRFLEELSDVSPPQPPSSARVDGGLGVRACGALSVSRLRIEPVSAMPLVLPSGGKRLWLSVENRGESPVSLETATFLDARGTVATQEHVAESADLFMSVEIPGHTRREVSAVFAGARANQVSAVEMKASFVDAAPGGGCSVRWPL
jgi:hypothetical protein